MTANSTTVADIQDSLLELIEQRRRLWADARYDPEARADLEDLDRQILAAKRELGTAAPIDAEMDR